MNGQVSALVLCVDDESRLLDALRVFLETRYSVITGSGAEAALRLLVQHPKVAVILSDMLLDAIVQERLELHYQPIIDLETGRVRGFEGLARCVETEEMLQRVREIGASLVQGYLFARPMPVSELESWLAEPRAERQAVMRP